MRVLRLLLLLLVPAMAPETLRAVEIRVNVGGPWITLPDGRVFLADAPYSPTQGYGWMDGWDHDTWHGIGGCVDERLYQTMHHAPDLYRVDVPNGPYVVTLHLADIWSHGVGQRSASWKLNGTQVISNLDIYALVERDYALDYRFAAQATSGQIRIEDNHYNGAMLYGVSVVDHAPDAVAPAPPVLTEILAGYGQVILNWEDGEEPDLAGYEITRRRVGGLPGLIFGSRPNLVSRYVDNDVIPGVAYDYWLAAVDVFGNRSPSAGPWRTTPRAHEDSPLPVCYITIDPDSLAALNEDPTEEIYYSCVATLDGVPYDAGLRYRGNVVRSLLKKSYKIRLADGLSYQGRDKLNCNSEMCDPSLMRESISLDLFRDAGVPAPRTWWRTLVLNGQCMGAYCDVEQPDADFLAAQGLDETANLYKCEDRLVTLPDSLAYVTNYQKETNEGSGYDDLIAFIETLNETPDGDFYETFIDILDIDEYIDYYALLMLINDGDAIFKNFLLYHDLEADWWMVIPWDKDLTWGVRWPFLEGLYWTSSLLQGASAGGNILTWRLLNQPVLRNLYLSRLYESISERFPRDDLSARIDAAHELTRGSGEVDFRKWYWEDNTRLRQGAEELREFAEGRYAYIFTQLDGLFTPQELYINEFMAGNSRTITDEYGEYEDWIEIYNPGPAAVAMGDYFLTDNLNEPVRWAFPDTLLPAGAHLLVWADEDGWQGPLHANFKLSRNGELIALHKKEPGAGSPVGPDDIDPVDLVYFGPQVDDIARARFEDGNLRWAFADSASPGASNPPGQGIDDPHLPPADLTSLRLHVWPNPSAGAVHFDLPCAAGGAIEIFDVSGRLCRRLSAPSPGPAGQSRWVWNGDAFGGRPASPGAYWARYQATGREAGRATRVILIR